MVNYKTFAVVVRLQKK